MAEFEVKITTDSSEVEKAQRLRFEVFNIEMNQGLKSSYGRGLVVDEFDPFCEHLRLVALVHLWVTVLRLPNRWKIISKVARNFTFLLRLILNIKVTVLGNEGQLERGGYVVISNHVGYVDGIVLGGLFPIIFVPKKEVRSWPVIGQWTRLCGTIFIDRHRKEKVISLIAEMTKKLN